MGTLTDWRGLYNHESSNPIDFVPVLLKHLSSELCAGKTLKEIADAILMFDEFPNYLRGGVCRYCGKVATEAHSIGLDLLLPELRSEDGGSIPDPDLKLHEHFSLDEISEFQWTAADLDADGLSIEWLYILDPECALIHVFDLRRRGRLHVGDVRIGGTGPSAQELNAIECGAGFERCSHLAWIHFPDVDRNGPQGSLPTDTYLGL